MATLSQNLKAKLEADATLKELIGTRVFYNTTPQGKDDYIFIQQTGSTHDVAIDDSAGVPNRYQYTVEAYSAKQVTMRAIIVRCQAILNLFRGTLGDQTVQGIFAEQQSDDYTPLGIGENSPEYWGALALEVVT